MKRFLGVRREEKDIGIEATFVFISVKIALTFITLLIAALF